MDPADQRDRIRFGPFEFDATSLELHRQGFRVRIQGQPLQVLARLLSRPGALVTRDALRTALWPEGTFVDFEHGLNAAIRRLRRALDDQASTPRFIETLARRGYRFVARLSEPERRSTDSVSGWSVAVLPFHNAMGGNESDDLLDGFTERVISELSVRQGVRVIARSAVFQHKGSRSNPRTIGRRLGVDGVLVGTVSQRDEVLWIHTELVDVRQGFQLWGRQYQRPLGDLTGLEQDLARQIRVALRVRLRDSRRLSGEETRHDECRGALRVPHGPAAKATWSGSTLPDRLMTTISTARPICPSRDTSPASASSGHHQQAIAHQPGKPQRHDEPNADSSGADQSSCLTLIRSKPR